MWITEREWHAAKRMNHSSSRIRSSSLSLYFCSAVPHHRQAFRSSAVPHAREARRSNIRLTCNGELARFVPRSAATAQTVTNAIIRSKRLLDKKLIHVFRLLFPQLAFLFLHHNLNQIVLSSSNPFLFVFPSLLVIL